MVGTYGAVGGCNLAIGSARRPFFGDLVGARGRAGAGTRAEGVGWGWGAGSGSGWCKG